MTWSLEFTKRRWNWTISNRKDESQYWNLRIFYSNNSKMVPQMSEDWKGLSDPPWRYLEPWTSIDNTATFLSKVQASHSQNGCFLKGSRCLFGGPFCRSKNPWNSPCFTGEWLGCSEFPYFLTVEGWVLCIFITATRWAKWPKKRTDSHKNPGRLVVWVFPKIGVPQNGWFTNGKPY